MVQELGFPPLPLGATSALSTQQSFSKHLSRTSPRLQLASVCLPQPPVSPAIDLGLTPTRGPGKRLH